MTRCRDETIKALEGFLLTMRRTVEEKTNTSSETEALKKIRAERSDPNIDRDQRREEEKELWDIIKVQTVTRMVATAYAHSILFLVLTVQVNLLGGRLFEEQMSNPSSVASMSNDSVASGRMGSYQESHRFVLMHTYEYFFSRGLVSLVNTVERAVSDVLADWNVLDRSSLDMSLQTFNDAVQKIRNAVERGSLRSSGRNRPRSLMRYLMPPSANMEVPIEDELARSILDETWDLLESPVLVDAQQDCLNATFDMMREQYWGGIFEDPQSPSGFTTKPLAHVLTQLKKTSNSFYSQEEIESEVNSNLPRLKANPYCAMMETLPAVLELADVSFN